jgi:hypothetical protein
VGWIIYTRLESLAWRGSRHGGREGGKTSTDGVSVKKQDDDDDGEV